MAAIDTPRVRYGASGTGRISLALEAAKARISAWNDRRMTRNALSRLSDRELEDIGLCRGDIEEIAAQY